jgi:hypothetical protein
VGVGARPGDRYWADPGPPTAQVAATNLFWESANKFVEPRHEGGGSRKVPLMDMKHPWVGWLLVVVGFSLYLTPRGLGQAGDPKQSWASGDVWAQGAYVGH